MRFLLLLAALIITLGLGCSGPDNTNPAPQYNNGIFQTPNEILFIGRDRVQASWLRDEFGNVVVQIADQDRERIPLLRQTNKMLVRHGANLFEKNQGAGQLDIADILEIKEAKISIFYLDVLSVISE